MQNKVKKTAGANKKKKQGRFQTLLANVRKNRLGKGLMRHFEWPTALIVLALSLFGVLAIYAATSTPVEEGVEYSFLEMLQLQPFSYARLQLMWIGVGLVAMAAIPGSESAEMPMLSVVTACFPWLAPAYAVVLLVTMFGAAIGCLVALMTFLQEKSAAVRSHRALWTAGIMAAALVVLDALLEAR